MTPIKLHKTLVLTVILLIIFAHPTLAFGAGNIASVSKIEGKNWRHGDIEDTLAAIAFIGGKKFSNKLIKKVYFGNWLRDYSQAVDVGSLKGVQKDAIRIIVSVLAFMSFGYATEEFEVTEDRLGTYQAHEHIDNPRGYPDDAQQYDPRLRGPVQPQELEIDPNTGMKNYVANESGGWATSTHYIKWSISRSIHFGRLYTSGHSRGQESDLYEALRCLGQALHTFEDFSAHSNYVELALRELGHGNVFTHTGSSTEVTIRGKRIFPLTTGTFGGLDFVISVLGEAGDHVAQSEVDEVNTALYDAVTQNKSGGGASLGGLTSVLGKIPGTADLIAEAGRLQREADVQTEHNTRAGIGLGQSTPSFQAPPGSLGGPAGPGIPGMNMDPEAAMQKIFPILIFRDKVVRNISAVIEKIPGLEALIETITERLTLFVMALIAPFIAPVIKAVSESLKTGNNAVIASSQQAQFEVWDNPQSSDPTHSLLSKDHFSNILNEPAGKVAAEVVKYVAPRIVYGWENPNVPVHEIFDDIIRVFHHPALRDGSISIHHNMFSAVESWSREYQGQSLDHILSSESVKAGKNHVGEDKHSHGSFFSAKGPGAGSHSKVAGSPFETLIKSRESGVMTTGGDNVQPGASYYGQGYGGYGQQQPQAIYSAAACDQGQGYHPAYHAYGLPSPQEDAYQYTPGPNHQQGYGDGHQQQPQPGQYGYPTPPQGVYSNPPQGGYPNPVPGPVYEYGPH